MRKEVIGDCTLYLGDCAEIHPYIGTFDALVTDPPYGIGESSKNFSSRSKIANADKYENSDWDDEPVSDEILSSIRGICNSQIIFGGNYFTLPPTSCWLVWDKQNSGDFADCELAWTNLNKAVRRIYWRWNGMIRRGDDVREHPTQKPEGVMSWCIEQLPKRGSVFDPFMGSGTTGVSCAKMGLPFTGIEMNEKYFDVACERIRKAYLQPDMLVSAQSETWKQGEMI